MYRIELKGIKEEEQSQCSTCDPEARQNCKVGALHYLPEIYDSYLNRFTSGEIRSFLEAMLKYPDSVNQMAKSLFATIVVLAVPMISDDKAIAVVEEYSSLQSANIMGAFCRVMIKMVGDKAKSTDTGNMVGYLSSVNDLVKSITLLNPDAMHVFEEEDDETCLAVPERNISDIDIVSGILAATRLMESLE